MPSDPANLTGTGRRAGPLPPLALGSEMATIIPFPVRAGTWPHDDRAALAVLRQMLDDEGLRTSFEAGVSDEGDPWALFYSLDDGNALAHVARWRSGVVLVWADGNVVRAPTLENLVDAVRQAINHGETTVRRRR
jgi:hypothetical protein